MVNFGDGPTLREASQHLRDEAERHARILDVVERNSVIEGLPPFTAEIRRWILARLKFLDETAPAPQR